MRTASTQLHDDLIFRQLKSSNSKAALVLEWDNNGTWETIEDVDMDKGVNWSKSSRKYKYANWSLTPATSSIDFNIINVDGKYSPESGETDANRFDLDTKIRLKAGYTLNDTTLSNTDITISLTNSEAIKYYMKHNVSGYIELDETNAANETDISFTDLFGTLYDSETYDDSSYTPAGYFLSTYDITEKGYTTIDSIDVTCNNTNGTIYWRTFQDRSTIENEQQESSFWINAGSTINGTVNVNTNDVDQFIQVAVVFDGVSWDDDIRLNSIVLNTVTNIEWVYYDVFYLDTPSYTDPKQPMQPMILCKGRDIWKRAIENEINLEDLSAGVSLDQLIKDICDIIGISYSATSIANLTSFSNRNLATGWGSTRTDKKLPKAIEIFETIIQIINGGTGTDYQMYIEYDLDIDDNILFLQLEPTDITADYVFNYQHYSSIGNKRKNYDKLLKRLTVVSEEQVAEKNEQLNTATYNSAQTNTTLTWSGNAEYKRVTAVNNSGDGVFSLDEVNPESIQFDITGSSIDMTVIVWGNKWTSDPTYEGEAINFDNMSGNKGSTSRIVNPLVISNAECKNIAEGFTNKFGIPSFEANNLSFPYLHLMLEQNDMCLVWSRWTFTDDLHFITGIKYHFDTRVDTCSFNLSDSGFDFSDAGDFIYDNVMAHDKGYVYDMAHGVGATESDIDISIYKNDINIGD